MSLLRERAIAVSVESTLRDFRPAAARDWFVSATSCFSDAELKALTLQAFVGPAVARRPTVVIAKARVVTAAIRLVSPTSRRSGVARSDAAVSKVIDAGVVQATGSGGR